MDPGEISEHGESVAEAPEGWVGGKLVHTGGNLFAREWIHPEKNLRVGYSIDNPSIVGVEEVSFEGSGDKTNPQMWQRITDVESEPCDGEEECLNTAIELMQRMGEGR